MEWWMEVQMVESAEGVRVMGEDEATGVSVMSG